MGDLIGTEALLWAPISPTAAHTTPRGRLCPSVAHALVDHATIAAAAAAATLNDNMMLMISLQLDKGRSRAIAICQSWERSHCRSAVTPLPCHPALVMWKRESVYGMGEGWQGERYSFQMQLSISFFTHHSSHNHRSHHHTIAHATSLRIELDLSVKFQVWTYVLNVMCNDI